MLNLAIFFQCSALHLTVVCTLDHDRLVNRILSNNRTYILSFSCAYLNCDKEGKSCVFKWLHIPLILYQYVSYIVPISLVPKFPYSYISEACSCLAPCTMHSIDMWDTVYPKKNAHGFVVLCFVVVMESFIMNSHEVFIHIHQGCFAGTGAIVRLPQCQWSKPDGYGKISQCITTSKHSKAKTVCIFLGIYCKACYSVKWKVSLGSHLQINAHSLSVSPSAVGTRLPLLTTHGSTGHYLTRRALSAWMPSLRLTQPRALLISVSRITVTSH